MDGWMDRVSEEPITPVTSNTIHRHLFLNIIPNNFTTRTERKVWCDQPLSD